VLGAPLVVGDTGDRELVARVLARHAIDTHFTSRTIDTRSVSDPLKYYRNNTCATATARAVRACRSATLRVFVDRRGLRHTDGGLAREDTPTAPINPYGVSKLMSEWMLQTLQPPRNYSTWRCAASRVAGSGPADASVTPRRRDAAGQGRMPAGGRVRPVVSIFGSGLPDAGRHGRPRYIHVEDLASAHLKALDYLRSGGTSTTLYCGYGHGYGVRSAGHGFPSTVASRCICRASRRAGDPPSLVAVAEEAVMCWAGRDTTTWQPSPVTAEWEFRLLKTRVATELNVRRRRRSVGPGCRDILKQISCCWIPCEAPRRIRSSPILVTPARTADPGATLALAAGGGRREPVERRADASFTVSPSSGPHRSRSPSTVRPRPIPTAPYRLCVEFRRQSSGSKSTTHTYATGGNYDYAHCDGQHGQDRVTVRP
jgi:UDP-glucose 4-epimerase